MQTQLLEIKELLSVWYLIVLENKILVAALVVAVWICFSILYSIRAYFLKKKIRITERKSNELKAKLNSAEQTIKSNEVTLATAEQQMEEEQQSTVEANKKVSERHQQVVEKIREVARSFDLSEQLVGSSDSISNEIIWQQQDNMVSQLTEKLTAEKNIISALEATHKEEVDRMVVADSSVKAGLELLTKQISQLELSALEQGNQQEIFKNELQGQLVDSLEKNQTEIIEFLSKLTVEKSTNKVTEELQIEEKPAEIIEVIDLVEPKVEEIVQEKVVEPKSTSAPASAAIPTPVLEPEIVKIDIPAVPVVDKVPEKVVESIMPTPVAVTAPAPVAPEVVDEVQAVPTQSSEKPKQVKKKAEKNKTKKILGFTQSLFSTKGLKKMPKQVVPPVVEVTQAEEVVSEDSREREEPVKLKKSDYSAGKGIGLKGKFKGLLNKKKK